MRMFELRSSADGLLINPYSDSKTSWWHATDCKRPLSRFNSPLYVAQVVDQLCDILYSLSRQGPYTFYELRLRASPDQVFTPHVLFRDWYHAFCEVPQWSGSAFESAQARDMLTDVGRSFYAHAYRRTYTLSNIHFLAFDRFRREEWFRDWMQDHGFVAWAEAETEGEDMWFEGADAPGVGLDIGALYPLGGINLGILNTSIVEIESVFSGVDACRSVGDTPSRALGRKNSQ